MAEDLDAIKAAITARMREVEGEMRLLREKHALLHDEHRRLVALAMTWQDEVATPEGAPKGDF